MTDTVSIAPSRGVYKAGSVRSGQYAVLSMDRGCCMLNGNAPPSQGRQGADREGRWPAVAVGYTVRPAAGRVLQSWN